MNASSIGYSNVHIPILKYEDLFFSIETHVHQITCHFS